MSSLSAGPLLGLPLPDIWFAAVFLVLGTFLLLDGFDFGVGVLFALADDHDREQYLSAIGPFWDGNEVWLVVFGGLLFAVFPEVYAALFSRYYLLMFAILAGLGLRGLAPELYEQREDDQWRRFWSASFVVGSTVTPFLLGVFVVNWLVGAPAIVTLPGVVGGLAVLALCVVDAVAFLGLKLPADTDDATRYGPPALAAYLALAVALVAAMYVTEPGLRTALTSLPVLGLLALSVVLGAAYVVSIRRETYLAAFAAVAGLVFGLVALVAVVMYPVIDRASGLTVSETVVSTLPLNLVTLMMAVFLPLVLGYFVVLYNTFSGPIEAGETY
ncbi:cytochrome d ubiquinol oxidase subunit II [Salarchaeum sp. JOR-1]|uniref:cytochrome d ubiquinol oxidase subunit II n=1 Tax=Salarchaeum sp. JOR-1 TaxID=2599399 RepID=UPI001198C044|nr:cytochrome d ubiquinol oxidase subunit II [Salarchaeum sp. JOR-1]QDX40988.1 cytochrome d ubiquinol oxidase subunit II [Salarchaeum sp. JOR-1]